MPPTRDDVLTALRAVPLAGGGDPVSADLIRALAVEGDTVRFVIEAPDPAAARALDPVRIAAEAAVAALPGVARVSAVLTAHGPAPAPRPKPHQEPPREPPREPPSLQIGRHPKPQAGPVAVPGVDRIIVVGSGKGGVGKSTLSTNLAVALAREGRRVGLLDADILGPSIPRMMGASGRPASPDGETIAPLHAHGVTLMSIGFLVDPAKAVIWRGPMLMGALQQMMGQVAWGALDVLIVDLPPGTGDVQLTLCQKFALTGAVVVSTPQDVALLDARKALDMFATLKTPVLGLVENMSVYICPDCGHEAHLFGHGGVRAEAERLGLPFLGALPVDLATRIGGDEGRPVAAGDGPVAEAYRVLARRFIDDGLG